LKFTPQVDSCEENSTPSTNNELILSKKNVDFYLELNQKKICTLTSKDIRWELILVVQSHYSTLFLLRFISLT